jgi:hypothetical protein
VVGVPKIWSFCVVAFCGRGMFCECVCFFCVGCCAPARKSGGRHVSYSFPLLVSPGVLVCLVGCSSRRLCLGLVVFGAPGLFVVRVESGAVF